MNDRIFADTNLFIYAHTDMDIQKQVKAQVILRAGSIFISTQVINEFINAARKKFNKEWAEVTKVVHEITGYANLETVNALVIEKAIEVARAYGYSYYDSLIIASAIEAGCNILYSEDLHDGQKIGKTLKIVNPFK